MVNQSQLEAVRELVRTSANLTDAERAEWLSLLGFMNDKQLSDLSAILQSSPTPHESAKASVPVKVVAVPAIAAPEVELDLPAPARPTQVSAMPAAAVSPSPNTVSAFINRNFATALHRPTPSAQPVQKVDVLPRTNPPIEPVAPTAVRAAAGMSDIAPKAPVASPGQGIPPVQIIAPTVSLPEVKVPTKPAHGAIPTPSELDTPVTESWPSPIPTTPVQPEEEISEVAEEVVPPPKNLEEVRRLNITTLRGRGVLGVETELKALCQKFGYFSVQFALEHSPLYQTYLAVGSRVLQQHQSFEGVQAELASGNRPYLTKPEFEEINDLLQRIKSG